MVRGREATPAYIKPDRFGLPRVVMTNVGNSRLLEFENPGTHIPAKNCNMRDLWDMIHVYVAPSHVEFAGKFHILVFNSMFELNHAPQEKDSLQDAIFATAR